jgi:trigger factor
MAVDQTSQKADIEVSLVEGQGWFRTMTVTVPANRVEKTRRAEAGRLSRSKRLKGFRRGKVPLSVIEQQFGAEIDDHVQQRLLDEAYREALDREELTPAGPGRITDVKYNPAEPFVFQAELEVMPTIKLDRLGGFKVERDSVEVADDEVTGLIDRIREENADWTEVQRSPVEGERVAVRILPLADGDGENNGDGTPYEVVLGAGQALEAVEQAIATLSPGNSGEFDIDFPDESGDEAASTSRRLRIHLDKVEERDLPELTDEFAAGIGPFETVEDLRRVVTEDLTRHHEAEAEGKLRGELLTAISEANKFVVPEALIDRYVAGMIQSPDDVEPAEMERMREAVYPHAEKQIREQLILDKVIEREGFTPSAEEVEGEIGEIAARRGVPPGKLRRELVRDGSLESLGRNLAVEKAFGYLKDQSGIS